MKLFIFDAMPQDRANANVEPARRVILEIQVEK